MFRLRTVSHFFAVCISALVVKSAGAQQLVPAKSEITFVSRQMGVPVDGSFKRFDASVAFDPKAPQSAHINLAIDLASVSLGTTETEEELAKPEWFGTKAHPKATFESSKVTVAGAGHYNVVGKLSIKGLSQAVVVPVTLAQVAGVTVATGSFGLKRRDFRIGDGEWNDPSLVADEVQVNFKLALTGMAAL